MFDYKKAKNEVKHSGLKQLFVAKQIGISEKALSQILSGKMKCSVEIYAKLCSVVGVPIGSFLTSDSESTFEKTA